jgi:hypothetical protein
MTNRMLQWVGAGVLATGLSTVTLTGTALDGRRARGACTG